MVALNKKILGNVSVLTGVIFVWTLVIGMGTVFSGLFNIDSIMSVSIQMTIFIPLLLVGLKAKNNHKLKRELPTIIIGLAIGTFIGFTFVAIGIWHGIYPPSVWYPPFFYPSGEYSYQSGCPVRIIYLTPSH